VSEWERADFGKCNSSVLGIGEKRVLGYRL